MLGTFWLLLLLAPIMIRYRVQSDPGFTRWIEVSPPKGLELLMKTWIPTFTRCLAYFCRLRLIKSLK